MEAKVIWQADMRFMGIGPSGHAVLMDGATEVSEAPRPTELLLFALGGCTGMDVISILRKMRTPPRRFEIIVQAERKEAHPKSVRNAHLIYRAEGAPEENLRKAAELSLSRYCSVANSLSAKISFSVEALP